MPLEINTKCQKRLTELISGALPKLMVVHNKFLDTLIANLYLAPADKIIPQYGHLRNKLNEYISERPIVEFIIELINKEIENNEYSKENNHVSLTNFTGFENPETKARYYVEQLCSLPWKNTLSIQLPSSIGIVFNKLNPEYLLTKSIRMTSVRSGLANCYPLPIEKGKSDFAAILRGFPPDWDDESIYLQVDVDGLVGRYGTTAPAISAVQLVRSICGLAIATNLLQFNFNSSWGTPKSRVIVHRLNGTQAEYQGVFELNENHSFTFSNLEPIDFEHLGFNEANQIKYIEHSLTEIGKILNTSDRNKNILKASRWLFDSYGTKDELLKFVQLMIVLEILLGDKNISNEVGLGLLLGNRCAYLIGNTHSERSTILDEFQEIYKVRSKIVHSGQDQLSESDRTLSYRLRYYCSRVIQAEVKLLKADIDAEEHKSVLALANALSGKN